MIRRAIRQNPEAQVHLAATEWCALYRRLVAFVIAGSFAGFAGV